MKKIIFTLLYILNCLSGMLAQDSLRFGVESKPVRSISFFLGGKHYLKLDGTYSRLAKQGLNYLIGLGYERLHNGRINDLHVDFASGTLKTKGSDFNPITNFNGNVRLRHLRKINDGNPGLYLGGNINAFSDVWFPKDAELRYAWDIYFGVGIAAALRYKFNSKLLFQYHLDFPALGVIWRPHNNGQQLSTEELVLEKGIFVSAFENPGMAHVLNTIYLENSFKLHYAVSKKITVYYNFLISYDYISTPVAKKGYEFNNFIGLSFNL